MKLAEHAIQKIMNWRKLKMKIGFIGLGIMGKPMAENLQKAGHELVVNNLGKEPAEKLLANGAVWADTGAEVAEQCDVIITMLPNSPNVWDCCFCETGVAKTAKPGSIVIDMSSIDPVESAKIGKELEKSGIRMIDAPVSGGQPMAVDGTLAIMVGGKKEDFDEYYDLLMIMGSTVTYVGPLGSGNVAKLANQIMVAVNIAGVAEALTLAVKNGADPELVYEAVKGGLASSRVLDVKAPMMMAHNFEPGFRIDLHIKDLNNVMSAAEASNTSVPLSAAVLQMMTSIRNDGCGSMDHSALVKYYEKISDTSVEKK